MSSEGALSVHKPIYTGTDMLIEIEVLDDDDVPVDVVDFSFSWMLKESRDDADADALITKTSSAGHITVGGMYSATRSANQQRVRVAVLKADTLNLEAGVRRHELKRVDAGQNSVIVSDKAVVIQAVHHA